MPGSTPATSQLDWLSSTTAMIVLSWSKATRDLLKSFSWGIGALRQLFASDDGAISSPPAPYHLSPLERDGFEPLVPRQLRHESPRFPKHPGTIAAPTAEPQPPLVSAGSRPRAADTKAKMACLAAATSA